MKNFKSIQEKWERDLGENMLERERAKKIARGKKHRVSWGKGKRVRTQKRQMTVDSDCENGSNSDGNGEKL